MLLVKKIATVFRYSFEKKNYFLLKDPYILNVFIKQKYIVLQEMELIGIDIL